MTSQLFMWLIKVKESSQTGMDMPSYLSRLQGFLGGYTNASKVVHTFKVTGEPRVVAIFEVTNVLGMERNLAGLSRMGVFDVTCYPVISYEKFAAETLGVNPQIIQPSTHELNKKYIFWIEMEIDDSVGSSELFDVWRREAEVVFNARLKGSQTDIFKVVAQRKVQIFISKDSSEEVDKMFSYLPLVQVSGLKISTQCRALQHLSYYTSRVMTEQL